MEPPDEAFKRDPDPNELTSNRQKTDNDLCLASPIESAGTFHTSGDGERYQHSELVAGAEMATRGAHDADDCPLPSYDPSLFAAPAHPAPTNTGATAASIGMDQYSGQDAGGHLKPPPSYPNDLHYTVRHGAMSQDYFRHPSDVSYPVHYYGVMNQHQVEGSSNHPSNQFDHPPQPHDMTSQNEFRYPMHHGMTNHNHAQESGNYHLYQNQHSREYHDTTIQNVSGYPMHHAVMNQNQVGGSSNHPFYQNQHARRHRNVMGQSDFRDPMHHGMTNQHQVEGSGNHPCNQNQHYPRRQNVMGQSDAHYPIYRGTMNQNQVDETRGNWLATSGQHHLTKGGLEPRQPSRPSPVAMTNAPSQMPHRQKTFPQKLMCVLVENPREDAFVWTQAGNAFVVVNRDLFISCVLSRAFTKIKFTSFVRKLNRWGFVRVPIGASANSFYHPLFTKSCPHNASHISCVSQPREIPRQEFSSSQSASDFSTQDSQGTGEEERELVDVTDRGVVMTVYPPSQRKRQT